MPTHGITKSIEFSYGHRLLDYEGKCRYLHGHNGVLEVEVQATTLDAKGMVLDFNELRDAVKGWVDANLDHRMVLCRRDPAVPVLGELGEPLYLMDENPTAENIAKLIFEHVAQQGVPLWEIRLWETSTSYASYRGDE